MKSSFACVSKRYYDEYVVVRPESSMFFRGGCLPTPYLNEAKRYKNLSSASAVAKRKDREDVEVVAVTVRNARDVLLGRDEWHPEIAKSRYLRHHLQSFARPC